MRSLQRLSAIRDVSFGVLCQATHSSYVRFQKVAAFSRSGHFKRRSAYCTRITASPLQTAPRNSRIGQ